MWKTIDWKGRSEVKSEKGLHNSQIQKYLKYILFSSHSCTNNE